MIALADGVRSGTWSRTLHRSGTQIFVLPEDRHFPLSEVRVALEVVEAVEADSLIFLGKGVVI